MLNNGGKGSEKCNFYTNYFEKKKKKNDNADPPYLAFPKLKPETHIYVWNYELILDTVAV